MRRWPPLNFESVAVCRQLAVLKRKTPRPRLRQLDRWFWVLLSKFWPEWRDALVIVKPATVIAWQRQGNSRSLDVEVAPAPRTTFAHSFDRMCRENPLWGARRIDGELLKLGFGLSERTVKPVHAAPSETTLPDLADSP